MACPPPPVGGFGFRLFFSIKEKQGCESSCKVSEAGTDGVS